MFQTNFDAANMRPYLGDMCARVINMCPNVMLMWPNLFNVSRMCSNVFNMFPNEVKIKPNLIERSPHVVQMCATLLVRSSVQTSKAIKT